MILRRFMQHIKEQNWFAVGLDVIVVIVGIFLGMQVTEWNEKRKEGETIGEVHKKLQQDFDSITRQAKSRLDFTIDTFEDVQYLVQTIRSPNTNDYDESKIARALEMSDFNVGNPKTSATWTALVSSGKQHYIKNEELRQALIEYHRGLDEAREAYQEIRMSLVVFYTVYKRHYDLKDEFNIRQKLKQQSIGLGVVSWDIEAMRNDIEFQHAAAHYMQMQYIYAINHNTNLENAAAVATLIEESL